MTGIYIALATFLLTMAWYHRRKPHENKLDTIISLLGSIKEQYKTMDNQIAALIAQLNTKTDIIAAEVAQVTPPRSTSRPRRPPRRSRWTRCSRV
jgi:hypothetical protein